MNRNLIFMFLILLMSTGKIISEEPNQLGSQLKKAERIKTLIKRLDAEKFAFELVDYSLAASATYFLFRLSWMLYKAQDTPEILAMLAIFSVPLYWAGFIKLSNREQALKEQIEDLEEELKILEAAAA